MNIYIFSSPINIFKILLKSSHNIKSVLSSSIFLSHKPAIFGPFKTRKSRDGANTTLKTGVSTCPRQKPPPPPPTLPPLLWTTETTIFIRMIARVFIQCKQPYLWFIENNDTNISWVHNSDNYFFKFSWTIHTYHLHYATSTTSSLIENGNFNVTVYKWNN